MTRLLAIDTTGDYCSLALKDGDHVLQSHQNLPRQHARQVLPLLDQLFAESGWARTSLDAVVPFLALRVPENGRVGIKQVWEETHVVGVVGNDQEI